MLIIDNLADALWSNLTRVIGGFPMEKPPLEFKKITHFSVPDTEKVDPRIDCITRLTLEIGSELPKGNYCLELTKPFPPLCRGGQKLKKLRSLRHDEIEYISAFPKHDGNKSARIEIYLKTHDPTIVVKCVQIEGLPPRGENVDQFFRQ